MFVPATEANRDAARADVRRVLQEVCALVVEFGLTEGAFPAVLNLYIEQLGIQALRTADEHGRQRRRKIMQLMKTRAPAHVRDQLEDSGLFGFAQELEELSDAELDVEIAKLDAEAAAEVQAMLSGEKPKR